MKNKNGNVSKIALELNIPQPNVSQHLCVLKNAKIIEGSKKGAQVYYKVIDEQTENIIKALDSEFLQDLAVSK